MAKSDWIIRDANYSWINTDSVSTSHCLEAIGSSYPAIEYQNAQKDSRMISWFKSIIAAAGYFFYFYIRLSSDFKNYYSAWIQYQSANSIYIAINRYKNSVTTVLTTVIYSPITITNWSRFSFEAINDGLGNITLRFSLWNGSAFIPIAVASDTTTLGVDAAGYYRTQWRYSRIDDVICEVKT